MKDIYKGYFLYRYDGRYVMLDITRNIRIGDYMYESQARRGWGAYIAQGRQATGHDYTEQDEKTLEGYRSVYDQD